MSNPPCVSVIIPSYNHASFITDAVRSVLTQTFCDFELLVLDDGSTDDSWQVLTRLEQTDPRMSCWRQPNVGLVMTLNRLMDRVNGTYVALLGSDDVWLPERLAWGVADMRQDTRLSAAFCSFLVCDAQLKPIRHPYPQGLPHILRGADLIKTLVPHNNVGALTGFLSADAVRAAGPFARNFAACQDWDLWLRLSLQGELSLRSDVGALYRWHGDNMSSSNQAVHHDETLQILREMSPLVAKHYRLDDGVFKNLALKTAREAISALKPRYAVDALIDRAQTACLDGEEAILLLLSLALAEEVSLARQLCDEIEAYQSILSPQLSKEFHAIKSHLNALPSESLRTSLRGRSPGTDQLSPTEAEAGALDPHVLRQRVTAPFRA